MILEMLCHLCGTWNIRMIDINHLRLFIHFQSLISKRLIFCWRPWSNSASHIVQQFFSKVYNKLRVQYCFHTKCFCKKAVMKLTWRRRRRRRSEVEESELSGVVLGFFRGFARNGRVKGEAVNGNRGLEARVVVGSIFHGGVPWQAPTLLVAQLLHLRLVHFLKFIYYFHSLNY